MYTHSEIEKARSIFGVDDKASEEGIKKAYRKLVLKYHPDKAADYGYTQEQAQKLFTNLQNAFETLSDTAKRRYYDSTLR